MFFKKHILFTTSRCFLKSKLITNLECSNDNTTLSFKIDTVKEIEKCYGLSNINFYVFGNKHTIQLRKLRTEFCDALTVYKPRTLMSLVNQGIYGSINNFPKRCPFLTVSYASGIYSGIIIWMMNDYRIPRIIWTIWSSMRSFCPTI